MLNLIYDIFFLIISLYVLLKTIGYALYEINTVKNKSGGIVIITFSILVVIFSNIIVWIN